MSGGQVTTTASWAPDTADRTGAGFARLVRAEWTKLVTVPRWLLGLAAMSLLTVGFAVLTASGSRTDVNDHRDFVVGPDGTAVDDDFYFVHRRASGDVELTARVTDQAPSHPGARAGLLVKQDTTSGSRYASVAFTPGEGVRFDADFGAATGDLPGTAPGWLRLDRQGSQVRGYVSDDGDEWRLVGVADLSGVAADVEVGMFVTSPGEVRVERDPAGTSVGEIPTEGSATFSDVALQPSSSTGGGRWRGDRVARTGPPPIGTVPSGGAAPGAGPVGGDGGGKQPDPAPSGSVSEDGGRYRITGSGDIARDEPPDDTVQIALFGAVFGLMALAAVAVLFATSEHKRHMVWATFAASPRRRRVLAAKAVVVATTGFGLGLASATAAYLVTRPVLRSRGFAPPAFAPTSLTQPGVLRAVVGTAVLLAAFGLLGLALGSLLRRSSGAIAAVFSLGIVPLFGALVVPATGRWLLWLTPAGGFAVQRAKAPTAELAEPWSHMNPWAGLAVTCTYAVVALALALWTVERRDA